MALPIFIIQWGNSNALKYCLHQARHYNPKSEIVLIGDRTNNKYSFVRHYHASGYSFNANIFAKTYTHSVRTPSPLKGWFKRWFILRDFMQRQRHGEQFAYINSNVLLYCDVTREFEKYKDYSMAICGDRAFNCSFFNSINPLEQLCDLIINLRRGEESVKASSDIYNEGEPGNKRESIDDLAIISGYRKRYPGQMGDNSVIVNGETHDSSITDTEGYEFTAGGNLKKIYWKEGIPCGKLLEGGNLVKFNSLNFAGEARAIMHRYYTGKNLRLQKILSEVRSNFSGFGKG